MSKGYQGSRLAKKALAEDAPHLQPPAEESAQYQKTWRSIVEDFPSTHFRESDRPTLHNYIRLTLILRQAEAQLGREGFMLEGPHGPVEHPAMRVVDKLTRNLLAHARVLRIVPTARLQNTQVPKDSEHLKAQLEAQETAPSGLKLAS